MIRLPVSLERKLQALFPRARDRDQFVADVVRRALEADAGAEADQPTAIGGTLHLYTDGGSRGNPGRAAVGVVLIDPLKDEVLREYGEAIGIVTNNIAEYRALITGMKIASEYRPNHLVCHLDSELVVKQLSGEYRVKMQTFQPLIEEINELRAKFPSVSFQYVPRAKNAHADSLVNRALDAEKHGETA